MTGQTRPMADVDELARRTTTLIAGLARKGVSLATGVVVVVLVICGLSYLTGLAALEGSARSAWTVVGLAMLVVAVGAPLLARWRLSAVTEAHERAGERDPLAHHPRRRRPARRDRDRRLRGGPAAATSATCGRWCTTRASSTGCARSR